MPPGRVRESCAPCRQRKTRCNAETPCSSCVLRGTEASCWTSAGMALVPSRRETLPGPPMHRDSLPGPSTPSAVSPSARRTQPTSRALDEVYRLKISVAMLETEVVRLEGQNARDHPAQYDHYGPVTIAEEENWRVLLAELPNRAACEILLEYLVQECDWLWHIGDAVEKFQAAIARNAVSSCNAGLICLYVAIPALLLCESRSNLYHPPEDLAKLHRRMVALARTFAPIYPVTIEDVDLLYALTAYLLYSGEGFTVSKIMEPAMRACEEQGFLDESHQSWEYLRSRERDERRRVVWNMVGGSRWKLLYLENDDRPLRVNVCQPVQRPYALTQAITLNLRRNSADDFEVGYRILRIKSSPELDRIERHRQIRREMTEILPRVRDYQMRMRRVELSDSMAMQCDVLYREMLDWRDRRLPRSGFPDTLLLDVNANDLVSCRNAVLAMGLRASIGHICANLLRPWLNYDVETNASDVQQALHFACLENAEWTMKMVSGIKTLIQSRQVPCISTILSANLFNTATTFAVPVLRAVRIWTTKDPEENIRRLPAWPANTYPRPHDRSPDAPAAPISVPAAIYIDPKIREYATNILVILDTLSLLNVNMLGRAAEKRLSSMIQQYSLRDSQIEPWEPVSVQASGPPSRAPETPMDDPAVWMDSIVSKAQPAEMGPTYLNGLLQLDDSIWEGLISGS